MSIEVMRQALEALELHAEKYPHMQKGYTVDAITALRQAIEQAEKVEPVAWRVSFNKGASWTIYECGVEPHFANSFDVLIEPLYLHPAPAQPAFIKHEVESAEDWSDWVCPDPDKYLIKCCDCGLVHEAQFRVVEYKPTPSEEFVVTANPDMQAQFRMKRHSAPAEPSEPQGWREFVEGIAAQKPEKPDYWSSCSQCERNASNAEDLLSAAPTAPAQQQPTIKDCLIVAPAQQPLTTAEIEQIREQWSYEIHGDRTRYIARAIEAAHGIKGASL